MSVNVFALFKYAYSVILRATIGMAFDHCEQGDSMNNVGNMQIYIQV